MEEKYSKDYRTRKYDQLSDRQPQRENKKPSFLISLLVTLLVLLVCSLGYDNIIKPYLDNREQQPAEPMATSTPEIEDEASYEPIEMTPVDSAASVPKVNEKSIQKIQPTSTKQTSVTASPSPADDEPKAKPTESVSAVPSEQGSESDSDITSLSEELSSQSASEIPALDILPSKEDVPSQREPSTLELLEKRNHENMVKQAKRAGVSTEGSTLEILDRINHANMVKQAKQAGVSTEGSTLDILERINHANMVKQAKRAGVSTEGSTLDILERINRKEVENMNR